jgi:GNAT superfamily N-acetyltransferase
VQTSPDPGPDPTRGSGPVSAYRVRLAWADDAFGIGRVQHESWRRQYGGMLPAASLADADADSFAVAWETALVSPPSARHRVLVALDGDDVIGFAAVGPSEDADSDVTVAELLALHVDPDQLGRGHGSRLLAAVVDTVRSDGFLTATAWMMERDVPGQRFLESAGWVADGAARVIGLDDEAAAAAGSDGSGEGIRQVRWHTDVRPAGAEA